MAHDEGTGAGGVDSAVANGTAGKKAKKERAENEGCLSYRAVRSRIHTGDVFLFRGQGRLSRFIQWGSGSPYSHAGMVAWFGKRLVVFQAVSRGIELVPASKAVGSYEGQVDWFSLTDEAADGFNRDTIIEHAMDRITGRYAYGSLLSLIARMFVRRFRFTADPVLHPDNMFCSQYVSYCYRMSERDLVLDAADDCTSPGDIANSELLVHRGVIQRYGTRGPEAVRSGGRARRRRADAPAKSLPERERERTA